jgi:hypothetical protein
MVCKNCGSKIDTGDNFCGSCGERTSNPDSRYEVFNYSVRQAKENKCHMPPNKIITYGLLFSVPISFGIIISSFVFDDMKSSMLFGAIFCTTMLALIIAATVQMSIYFRSMLSSIVLDREENTYYVVRKPMKMSAGWDPLSTIISIKETSAEADELARIAQNDNLMTNATQQYQNNNSQRTVMQKMFVAPEYVIVKLQNPIVIKRKKKFLLISYENERGARKKIKMANAFPGFEIKDYSQKSD